MILTMDIPDKIVAQTLGETLELSVVISGQGKVQEVYTQEYEFQTLAFNVLNQPNMQTLVKLKRSKCDGCHPSCREECYNCDD